MSLHVGGRPSARESGELKAGGGGGEWRKVGGADFPQCFRLALRKPVSANGLPVCASSESPGGKRTAVLNLRTERGQRVVNSSDLY